MVFAGLEIFRKQPPSVVVLDLNCRAYPVRSSAGLQDANLPSIPIVILSAHETWKTKVLLLELGADDYVTKPFNPKELLARVRERCDATDPSRRPLQTPQRPPPATICLLRDLEIDFTAWRQNDSGTRSP